MRSSAVEFNFSRLHCAKSELHFRECSIVNYRSRRALQPPSRFCNLFLLSLGSIFGPPRFCSSPQTFLFSSSLQQLIINSSICPPLSRDLDQFRVQNKPPVTLTIRRTQSTFNLCSHKRQIKFEDDDHGRSAAISFTTPVTPSPPPSPQQDRLVSACRADTKQTQSSGVVPFLLPSRQAPTIGSQWNAAYLFIFPTRANYPSGEPW